MSHDAAPRPRKTPFPSLRPARVAADQRSASPDVISNLLASFSAISLPPDEPARDALYPNRDPVSAPRTPPRTRLPPVPTYNRSSHLHVRSPGVSSVPSPTERSFHLAEDVDANEGDAAEPPVIRTSRSSRSSVSNAAKPKGRPGWRNRASFSFRSESADPDHVPTRLSPNEDDLGQLRRIVSGTHTLGTPSTTASSRPSMELRQPSHARFDDATVPPKSPASDVKGKARARAISPLREVSSGEEASSARAPAFGAPARGLERSSLEDRRPAKSPPERPSRSLNEQERRPSASAASEPDKPPSWRRRRDRARKAKPSAPQDFAVVGDDTGFVVLKSPTAPRAADSIAPSRITSAGPSAAASRAVSRDGGRPPLREEIWIPSRRSSLRNHSRSPPQTTSRSKKSSRQESRGRSDYPEDSLPPASAGSELPPGRHARQASEDTVNLDVEMGDLHRHQQRQRDTDAALAAMAAPRQAPADKPVPVDLDEDNEVTRRIKELKAANEKRRRDFTAVDVSQPMMPGQELPSTPRSVTRSLQMRQPSTTLASAQLQEAAQVKERRFVLGDADLKSPAGFHSTRDGKLGVPVASPGASDSRSRQSAGRPSRDSTEGAAVPSILSRSSSRTKRWSFSESTANGESPGRSHRRVDSKDRAAPNPPPATTSEGRRDSLVSIQESVDRFLQSPRLSRRIPAVDDFSRQVAFSEVGDPQGHAVVCCVGMGLTRYIMAYYEELATTLRLRLITPDRPGIGDSTAYGDNTKTPLSWPDDVRAIIRYLGISHFSLLAHSAGAIYAMATALRMPERVHGRIHLLAPWIPPSQMVAIGVPSSSTSTPSSLPRSQRFLRILPTSFLKFSTSNFMGRNNLVGNGLKSPTSKSRKGGDSNAVSPRASTSVRSPGLTSASSVLPSARGSGRNSPERMFNMASLDDIAETSDMAAAVLSAGDPSGLLRPTTPRPTAPSTVERGSRQQRYDQALTPAVWDLATRKANAAVDLLVCLERSRAIGFRYADVTQRVVIHHGSKDTRVPLDNVKWVAKTMRRAEVRVLDGEGHGLMASAGVMSQVLVEMSKEVGEPRLDADRMSMPSDPYD